MRGVTVECRRGPGPRALASGWSGRPGLWPLEGVLRLSSRFGLWRVRFPPCLVRPGRRLPVQGLSEGSLGYLDRLPA